MQNTIQLQISLPYPDFQDLKSTASPPERCDLDGVKLEKRFKVCRSCTKGVTFYMAYMAIRLIIGLKSV